MGFKAWDLGFWVWRAVTERSSWRRDTCTSIGIHRRQKPKVGEARVQNPKADYRTYEVERWDEVCV